jgi:hypothetical protein
MIMTIIIVIALIAILFPGVFRALFKLVFWGLALALLLATACSDVLEID